MLEVRKASTAKMICSKEPESGVLSLRLYDHSRKRDRAHHRAHDEEDNLGEAVVQMPPPPGGAQRECGDKNDKDGFDHD